MRITEIRPHVLLDPAFKIGATSSAQDDFVVEIETDDGVVGIGETDVNPWIAHTCIEAPGTHTMGQSLRDILIGADPREISDLWSRMYIGTAMNGRRGVVINVIGAIDIALHDLVAKAESRPCHSLLGTALKDSVVPYASLQPEVSDYVRYRESMVEWAVDAKARGFSAMKLEVTFSGPYAHMGLREPWSKATEVISEVRSAVGDAIDLMVDVQYAFSDAEECLAVLRDWQRFGLIFVETPVASDDLDSLAKVATNQDIPIAVGEWLTTRFEFEELMDRGKVQVVQPDVGRVGGLTEAVRVCREASDRGLTVVPHLWKTGLSVAAATHLAVTLGNCPYVEYLPPELTESALRRELLLTEPKMSAGTITLDETPGLGVALDPDAVSRFESAARAIRPW